MYHKRPFNSIRLKTTPSSSSPFRQLAAQMHTQAFNERKQKNATEKKGK